MVDGDGFSAWSPPNGVAVSNVAPGGAVQRGDGRVRAHHGRNATLRVVGLRYCQDEGRTTKIRSVTRILCS